MDESREMPDDLWSIVRELTHLHEDEFKNSKILGDKQATLEDCLIRVLRPHDDAGFRRRRHALQLHRQGRSVLIIGKKSNLRELCGLVHNHKLAFAYSSQTRRN